MLNLTFDAYVLSLKPMSERSALAQVFTREHGVYAGAVRISGKGKPQAIFQPGNFIQANWKARLAEHMGTLSGETIQAHSAQIMNDPSRLSALLSATTLIGMAVPEREAHPALYDACEELVQKLSDLRDDEWLASYAKLELVLLYECGFRLDLSRCAASGETTDLCYVSPKSGRAVSRAAGAPYHDKMLPLPAYLHPGANHSPDREEQIQSLQLSGYFLEHWLFEPHDQKLPAARSRLLLRVNENVKSLESMAD